MAFCTTISGLLRRGRTTCIVVFLVFSIFNITSLYLTYLKNLSPVTSKQVTDEKAVTQNINLNDMLNFGPVTSKQVADEKAVTQNISLHDMLNFGARPQVQTITSWNAPIIWEGMFDPTVYDQTHARLQSTVALTVFAVGRYLDAYLKTFLTSAEQHFMLGLPVTYYVFTDLPNQVPEIQLAPHRSLKVIKVDKYTRWQDISMMRMKTIAEIIDSEIRYHFRYVFCFDVDQVFKGRFGSEALGESVALLHAHFYKLPKERYTYDKNPKSKAFMETGDFYYHAAIFGGLCENVKTLADECYLSIMEDKINDVEALWHDESHLNKYFWLNKPSRLLSPEYCWDETIGDRSDIQVTRLVWAPKDYETLRT